MTTARVVVLRQMETSELEGTWLAVIPGKTFGAHYLTGDRFVEFVATGALEWEGNHCAEVYVPADRLADWQAEHEYPEESPWVL